MRFATDESPFAPGAPAGGKACAPNAKSAMTTTMGTGTGSHPGA